MVVDGREIYSACKEKLQARREYNQAVASGKTAFLVEERSRDTFSLSVGNIKPYSTAVVSLTYVSELELGEDGAAIKYVMPRSIAPRYSSTASANDAGSVQWPSWLAPMYNVDPHDFKLTVMYEMTTPIRHISSTHDALALTRDSSTPTTATSVIDRPKHGGLEADVVINVDLEAAAGPRLCIERHDADVPTTVAMLTFVPIFDLDVDPKGHFIFVVDTSGSMNGARMEETKAALVLFLQSLPEDSFFNIYSFNTFYTSLFKQR